MFNPCLLLTGELLEGMLKKGVVNFVRSTFERGLSGAENIKAAFLICHYHNLAEAQKHFDAITNDKYRCLYNATNPADLEKLRLAATQPAGFAVFSRVMIPEVEKKVTSIYRDRTARYIRKNTNWKLEGKGKISITPFLYFQLGELYVRISFEGDKIEKKFEELENS